MRGWCVGLTGGVFEKARAGDAQSIEQLVKQYSRLAYSIAYEWVRRGVISADDAIGEADLALMKCVRGNFDETKGKFKSYLARAVDNQIRMYLRQEKKEFKIEYVGAVIELENGFIDVIGMLADNSSSTDDLVEVAMLIEMSCGTLNEVTRLEGECLMLRIGGLTCGEIAEKLGLSQSYVSRLSLNAVCKLKEVLREME